MSYHGMGYYTYAFEGELSEIVYPDKYRYFVVRLADDLAARSPFTDAPRTRARGEINDHPFDGAFLPDGEARPYVLVSGDLVREIGVALGDPIELRFNVEDADAVDVPTELANALMEVEGAREAFDALMPGRRRGLAHEVRKPKQHITRERRAAKIAVELVR